MKEHYKSIEEYLLARGWTKDGDNWKSMRPGQRNWRFADVQEKTGYSVVCWMEENNVWPKDGVRVHSMNPVGKKRMQDVIARYAVLIK